MHWIWVLIVGAIIGAIAGAITRRSGAMGWISNIIAGLVGSAIGEALRIGAPVVGDNGNHPVAHRRDHCRCRRFVLPHAFKQVTSRGWLPSYAGVGHTPCTGVAFLSECEGRTGE